MSLNLQGFFYCIIMNVICYNGSFQPASQPALSVNNRSFRYGDGVFETMRMQNGTILLAPYHFERLFNSLKILGINPSSLSQQKLVALIHEICAINQCTLSAKIRLQVYREGNNNAYVIEAQAFATPQFFFNESMHTIDIFPHARKSCDRYSNLKSANYLPCVMAGLHAKKEGLDECLLLNSYHHICEGSRTNIFIILKNKIITPSLEEGCVNGVMRRFVIAQLKKNGNGVKEGRIKAADLFDAQAIFLTNAIQGICPAVTFQNKNYTTDKVKEIYEQVFSYA